MKQKELDSMTAEELLGLWSARREGVYEDPMPEGIRIASYGPSDPRHGVDDESHVALWVDGVVEVQRYRRALVILLGGGLMPSQALERATVLRQSSRARLRTWQSWAKAWGLETGNPLVVGPRVIRLTLAGIEREKKTRRPTVPDRMPVACEEDEIAGMTPDVNAKAEAKFPDRFAARGDGYLVVSCELDRNNSPVRADGAAA